MSLDVKIDEEDRALLLLCSLSVFYDGLITTLVYEKEILNFKKVVGVLRSNEQWEKLCKRSPNLEVLTVNKKQRRPKERTQDESKDRSKSWRNLKAVKCYKYYQLDHLRRNCPLLKNEKGKGKVGSTRESGALSSEDSGDDVLLYQMR